MPTGPISKATASEYAKLGQIKRKENWQRWKAEAASVPLLKRQIEELRATVPTDQGYISTTISRLRERTSKLLDQIATETDPQELQRLATAFDKLSEVEQKLSMRPLPGSLRPTKKTTRQSTSIPEPLD